MNELKLIENELVPVYVTSTGEKVVYGTELYEVLKVKSKFADWIKNRLNDCDAVENKDFDTFSKILEKGRPTVEYIIKLDIAKEMAMLERNDIGKQTRRYFIQVEKKYDNIKSVTSNNLEAQKIKAQQDRAKAMLLNAQNRTLKTLMTTIKDRKLSPIAAEVFGLKSIEEVTGISMGSYLPQVETTYSATEVGKMFGISSTKVGGIANKNNLKTEEYGITVMDKSPYSSKEVSTFRYNEKGVARVKELINK